jgi:hypothetical protein
MKISPTGFCFSYVMRVVILGIVFVGCRKPERADGKYVLVFAWDGKIQKSQLFRDGADSEVRPAVRDEVLRNAEPAIAEQLKKANLRYAGGKVKVTVSGPPPYAVFTGTVEISNPNISKLFAAVERENVDKIRLLTAQDHNVNQREVPSERTALFTAAAGSHVKSLQTLLELGADPALSDFEGDSPLHAAVVADSLMAVESLITAGSNVNARNRVGVTPLMVAANLGRIHILQILLRSGANISLKSDNGKTALIFARDAAQKKAIVILEPFSRESSVRGESGSYHPA